jgi:hypothetical protein
MMTKFAHAAAEGSHLITPRRPETTVGRSFRCGVHAVRTKDQANWARAWQELADASGASEADGLVARLAAFVEALEQTSARRIAVLPAGCPGLCRDECLAVSLVAAAQTGACPALRACAFALLETSCLERPLLAASEFADGLACAGVRLSEQSVANAAGLVPFSREQKN